MTDVTLPAAFMAGLVSFVSPCVLPLVPPYLCFLGGSTLDDLAGEEPVKEVGRRALVGAALFVAGFSVVFVALGAGASAIGDLLRAHLDILSMVAGIAICAATSFVLAQVTLSRRRAARLAEAPAE